MYFMSQNNIRKCLELVHHRPLFSHLTKTPFKKPIDSETMEQEVLKC